MVWLAVGLGSAAAGFLQTVTGFGAATVLMLVLPQFFDMVSAPALSCAICMGLAASLALRLRRRIRLRLVLLPTLLYTAASIVMIRLAAGLNLRVLTIAFGVFLILLSAYFLLLGSRASLKGGAVSMVVCSTVSGVCAGLFSIGGPTMALYYLAVTEEQNEYLANMQFLLAFTNAAGLPARISSGAYTAELLPLTLLGIGAILAGRQLGLRTGEKLNRELVKRLVFIYVGVTGALTLLQQIV